MEKAGFLDNPAFLKRICCLFFLDHCVSGMSEITGLFFIFMLFDDGGKKNGPSHILRRPIFND